MEAEHIVIEEQIVSILLSDKEAVKFWHQHPVTHGYFDEANAHILSGVTWAFNKEVQLTRSTYREFLNDYKKLTPAESAAQLNLYNRCLMRAAKRDDLPMLLDKVRSAFIRRKTSTYFNYYSKDREKLGDLGANRTLIEKLTALEADTAEFKSSFMEIHKHKEKFLEALMERRNNPQKRLICSIPEIDETMNVGFKVGHLTMFCADVGSFKTTMMVNVALNIFKNSGENVLYIPLEMPAEEILQKIVSRETKIPFDMIEHAEKLDEHQIEVVGKEMDKWVNMGNRFCILDFPERSKLSVIRREIEKRINYFKPRMVFIDYADNLVSDNPRQRSDLDMNDILEDMRKMGKALGFGTATAAQLARDGLKKVMEQKEGKQQLGSTDIRGGQVMTANSDTVYAQLRDPGQPNEKLLFFCVKSRHGKNVFHNKLNRTVLNVTPDIGLIESANDFVYEGPNNESLLAGITATDGPDEEPY